MVTTAEAEITPDAELGMFAQDTRLISLYKLWIDGGRWTLASSASVSYFGAVYVFLSPKIAAPDGTPEPGKVELHLERAMSGGGIHEDFEIRNYFQGEVSFDFAIEVQSDFADIFEVKRHQIPARECETSWDVKSPNGTRTISGRTSSARSSTACGKRTEAAFRQWENSFPNQARAYRGSGAFVPKSFL